MKSKSTEDLWEIAVYRYEPFVRKQAIEKLLSEQRTQLLEELESGLPTLKETETFKAGYDEGHRWGFNSAIKEVKQLITKLRSK